MLRTMARLVFDRRKTDNPKPRFGVSGFGEHFQQLERPKRCGVLYPQPSHKPYREICATERPEHRLQRMNLSQQLLAADFSLAPS